eukprot:TRINITY_DN23691_c0_g1_i1.p1 TRINITY_DN23691_c0_g1~~TRINITY_DN23691_c0_g1_i1.p1  ORF type:complete len:905 (+),score=243.45 TRINITY_DN23691_c0_g1_i1:70-2715(+)
MRRPAVALAALRLGVAAAAGWDFIGPFSGGKGEMGGDPVAAFGGPSALPTGARLGSELAPGGTVQWLSLGQPTAAGELRMPFQLGSQWAQGWARGPVRLAEGPGCYVVSAAGPVREVWLEGAPLLELWYGGGEAQKHFARGGTAAALVRLDGAGSLSFRLAARPCSPKRGRARLLPLAADDWDRGHELPDIAAGGVPLSALLMGRVELPPDARPSQGLRVTLSGGGFEPAAVALPPLHPGQLHAVALPLRLSGGALPEAQCPAAVELRVVGDGEQEHARLPLRLRCRSARESVAMVYRDADGSPQLASVKLPALRDGCPAAGCAVLLTTHGMDVTAQRQADCYRPMRGLWVLAPHGRGTHALNWQGPGHWSAAAALTALVQRARAYNASLPAAPRRVIYTGHSNGGFGAVLLSGLDPDSALGVAPLAGMATIGDSQHAAPPRRVTDPALHAMLDRSLAEYRGDPLLGNLVGVPFLARAGERDQVISPWLSRKISRLMCEHANDTTRAACRFRELKGKEHWWWDTEETNDGGVMNDKQMRKFWGRALQGPAAVPRPCFSFSCHNAASCGWRGGLRIESQRQPLRAAGFTACEDNGVWQVETRNVRRLAVAAASPLLAPAASSVHFDGVAVGVEELRSAASAAAAEGAAVVAACSPGEWRLCGRAQCSSGEPEAAAPSECCGAGERPRGAQGPLRRVYARPYAIVYGTLDPAWEPLLRGAALRLASSAARVAGAAPPVVADSEASAEVPDGANLVLMGGPAQNSVTARVQHPLLSGGGFAGGAAGCRLAAAGLGAVALLPSPLAPQLFGAAAALVAGTDTRGFLNAYDALMAAQWTTNHWQMPLPDWLITGPDYAWQGTAGVLGAGFWGHHWEFRSDLEYSAC